MLAWLLVLAMAAPETRWHVRENAVSVDALFAPVPRQADAVVGLELAPSRILDEETHHALEKALVQSVVKVSGVREVRVVVGKRSDELDYILTAQVLASSGSTEPPSVLLELYDAVDGERLGTGTCAVFMHLTSAPRSAELATDRPQRTREFYNRAWRMGAVSKTELGRGTRWEPRVLHQNGSEVTDDEILASNQDPSVRETLERGRRVKLVGAGAFFSGLVMMPLSVPVALLAGSPMLALLAFHKQMTTDTVAAGLLIGVAVMTGALVVTLLAATLFALLPVILPSWPTQAFVSSVVQAHNADLAEELELDPASLAPEYFPAGVPARVSTESDELVPAVRPP